MTFFLYLVIWISTDSINYVVQEIPWPSVCAFYALDKDRNDQSTSAKLEDAGFLVSDQFLGKNMFDFFF